MKHDFLSVAMIVHRKIYFNFKNSENTDSVALNTTNTYV